MKKFLFLTILHFGFLTGICLGQNKNIDSLLTLVKKDKLDTNKVKHLNKLSWEYLQTGDFMTGLHFGTEALVLAQSMNFQKGIANANLSLGVLYSKRSDESHALECYFKALKSFEEQKNKNGIMSVLGNIGVLYSDQGSYPKALDYYFKALKMAEELGYKSGIAGELGNIGIIYMNRSDYSKALQYYLKAVDIDKEIGNKNGVALNFGNIGLIYYTQSDYPRALEYYLKALKIAEELGDKNEIGRHLNNIGLIYYSTGKFKLSEQYLKRTLVISDSIGSLNQLMQTEESLSKLYNATKQYKLALIYFKKAIALKDTVFSQENKKQLVRKEMTYEFDKKEAATKAENEKQQAVAAAESKKQKIIIWSVLAGLLLVIVFSGFVFRSLRITRKQKNIIELQKNEVLCQKEIVEKQKEKITDSITYAQRIQQSILMEESEIQNYLPESFIYFQPKDIVSGDFYWFSKQEDKLIIAAVDCTGHGVPGAFMSMIGNTLLNQIVNEKGITTPSEILKYLNIGVYEALHQQKDGALSDDGMDISLCMIDYNNNEIQYAGAENPLYIVSNEQVEVIKADIYGIGGGGMLAKRHDPLKKEFTNHVIAIKEGMSIYLFSDGYMDQFGGSERKKFGTQKFKELLLNNKNLSMYKQKEELALAHTDWKGSAQQIDDILVIGIRI